MNIKFKLLISFLLCTLVTMFLFSCNRPIERSAYSKRELIYEESQSVIEKFLLSPMSAVFPEFKSSFVSDNEEEMVFEEITYHTYTVTAYVDSQNAFGTMVRQKYQVIIGISVNAEISGSIYYEIIYLE